jgi:2-polyprenyl-3-methyl-5-hydroxy-6-metoxy-1,4-benzoquinol methylase
MTITPEQFLEMEISKGIHADNPDFVRLAQTTCDQLHFLDFKSVLDYGAGMGVYSAAFDDAGFDVSVFEIWDAHRQYIRKHFPRLKIVDQPITTDLLLWIEVAEHMTDDQINELMESISPQYILFSSTPEHNPGFDQMWGHINIKTGEQWVQMFSDHGYNNIIHLGNPTPWTKLFYK